MALKKLTLTIPASGYQTSGSFNKEDNALAVAVRIPNGFQGLLGVRGSDDPTKTFDPIYDDTGALIQIDPTSITLPAWFVLKADVMPIFHLKFESYTDTTESTQQNQSAARELPIMGIEGS